MQWEILVAIILAIGIYTAIMETRAKRISCKNECKEAEVKQHTARETSKKQDG